MWQKLNFRVLSRRCLRLSKISEGVTIKIRLGTRDRLKDIGKKSETYDDIINSLIDQAT